MKLLQIVSEITSEHVADSIKTAVTEAVGADFTVQSLSTLSEKFVEWSIDMSGRILAALLVFVVGRFAISMVRKLLRKFLDRRGVEASVKSFVLSMVNILLIVLLVIAIVGKLGIETTSVAALLASMGLAVGMAFSGNLQNFAGGIIVLLFRPYKVGDLITTSQNITGTVQEIQIFHTIIRTYTGDLVYIPNNLMTSTALTNITRTETRLIELTIGVEYGTDYETVRAEILRILQGDPRILPAPAPFVALTALADSSVNYIVRATVLNPDYTQTRADLLEAIYTGFNKAGIGFPFPQITVHKADK